MERCPWCGQDPLYVAYHDTEWGSPVHDETRHFEFLLLETQQAGLSWITILRKREAYRRAFAGFDAEKVARFGEAKVETLLGDAGIIRNRRKIEAAVKNARAFLAIQEDEGSFDTWLWRFVDGRPVLGGWRSPAEVPATSPLSDLVAKELKSKGFAFVVINDHLQSCFRHAELAASETGQR